MYVESCTILVVVVNRLSRPVVVLDGLLGLYGFKYDSATACGLPLYLYSYKLVGSVTIIGDINLCGGGTAPVQGTPSTSQLETPSVASQPTKPTVSTSQASVGPSPSA